MCRPNKKRGNSLQMPPLQDYKMCSMSTKHIIFWDMAHGVLYKGTLWAVKTPSF